MGLNEYRRNSLRVREIYGIDSHDKRYNIHHIIQKSDYKRDPELYDQLSTTGRFNINQVSNLCPVLLSEHSWINRKINSRQESLPRKINKHRRKRHR